ncbi:MAG: helix-turn-helix domain-containing protein [Tepidiformaceae bacterium]
MTMPVKRPYRSPLRAEQQATTRRQVIVAAGALFVRDGYAATSIEAIAEAAGVSRATVFSSVGGKAALLKLAYDVAIVGDDEPIALPERPWAQAVRDERDADKMLSIYAAMVTAIDGRVAAINEAVRGAAGADEEARELWVEIQRQRQQGASNVVAMLTERGGLRVGLDSGAAADIVAVFIDPGVYLRLVGQRGWPRARFEAWFAETLRTQLLPPRPPPRG